MFEHISFKGVADFQNSEFLGNARFGRITFGADADFRSSRFHGNDNAFVNSVFDSIADFSWTWFKKDASFIQTTFGGDADFFKAQFDRHARFTDVVFEGSVDFRSASFAADTRVSKTNFRRKIDLRSIEFEKNILYVPWNALKTHLICNPPVYLHLMKYFEEERRLGDADGVYLALKNNERMEKTNLQRYLEYWLIQQTCGYGVKPWRPLLASLIVIMVCSCFYYKLVIRDDKFAIANSGWKRFKQRFRNSVYYSFNTFISGAPPGWILEQEQPKKVFRFRIITTIERTLGWILLVLFVVTLTRKFIR